MVNITALTGRLGNQMFQYAYLYSQYRDGLIPDIYIQDEKYFEKYKDEIKSQFKSGISNIPYVAIHVRRGDYVGNDFYVDLFADGYYERAMKEFPDSAFIIFSDDIPWCKEQNIFEKCAFSDGFDEVEDLNIMASCCGHIIANSSFSWWGAFLSPNGGKVIAPSRWYTDGVERTKIPNSWIKV
jgi:hypothetical protein